MIASGDRETAAGVKNVLVVDDSPDMRNLLTQFLRYHGHAVRSAEDGLDALEVLQKSTPDVILLDLNMPRLDGLDFLKALRGERRWDGVRVIVVTGYDAGITDDEAKSFAVDAVLAKCTDRRKLVALVEQG